MIELADTTFRAYRKKSGAIALHLRGYLLVHTDAGFRLSAYLRDIRCWITLPGKKEHECDSVSFSEWTVCKYDGQCMLHDLWVSTIIPDDDLRNCVADMKLMYHINFTGHPVEEPAFIERKVPVVARFVYPKKPRPPNQALESTRGSVTSRADVRLAPAPRVPHL